MAAEKSAGQQNLILENRKHLTISGVEEVNGFDDGYVQLQTALGEMLVYGRDLTVEELSVETGELTIRGEVVSLEYRETPEKRSFFARLFGKG